MKISDLTITSVETITGFDITTGYYRFVMDELQSVTISQSEEKTDITGKQGRKLSSLKKNKAVTISGTNGMISGGLLEMQTGGEFIDKADAEVMWPDYLTVSSNSATISYKAVGTEGDEITSVYVKNSDGTLGTVYTQSSSAGDDTFTYDSATKALTFKDGAIEDGTEIVAYYKRQLDGSVLTNESDVYSGKCTLYVDVMAEDKCANIYRVQIFIPKADFSGEFSLEMGDSQAVHSFEAEALSGACGAGGKYWTYTVYGENAEDAA